MIIMQGSASEDEASDDSSSTVEDEDKEFSANEEDGKCDFIIYPYIHYIIHIQILKKYLH